MNARRRKKARDSLVDLMIPVHMRKEKGMLEQEKAKQGMTKLDVVGLTLEEKEGQGRKMRQRKSEVSYKDVCGPFLLSSLGTGKSVLTSRTTAIERNF
jgi:hypothetical protein